MDFAADEQEQMIRQAVAAYAEKSLQPSAAARDVAGDLDAETVKALAALGVFGMGAAEQWGGLELDAPAQMAAFEELAANDAGVAYAVLQHHTLALGHLLASGSPAQKAKYAKVLASGTSLACWAHSEATDTLDSDFVATQAHRLGDGRWQIDGHKPQVWLGGLAKFAVITAQCPDGLTAFVVDLTALGVSRTKCHDLLGLRAATAADLTFVKLCVSDEARLGAAGQTATAVAALQSTAQLAVAAIALGIGRSALRAAGRYALQREQFGKPIAALQPIQWQIANSTLDLAAARALLQRAAFLLAHGKPAAREIAMAKFSACDGASRIADRAIQIHGGYGYTMDFSVERAYRDAAVLQMLHGSSALQRVHIAQSLSAA